MEPKINDIVVDTILLYHSCVWILFDTGATHSFISLTCAKMLELYYESIKTLNTPLEVSFDVSYIYKNCLISFNGHKFQADLFIINISYFDIILGMEWLTKYQDIINCFKKKVTVQTTKGIEVQFYGRRGVNLSNHSLSTASVEKK